METKFMNVKYHRPLTAAEISMREKSKKRQKRNFFAKISSLLLCVIIGCSLASSALWSVVFATEKVVEVQKVSAPKTLKEVTKSQADNSEAIDVTELTSSIDTLTASVNQVSKMNANEPEAKGTESEADAVSVVNETEEPTMVALGEFKLTFYCPCTACCGKDDGITRTGTLATQGRTIAVDGNVIPLGSRVYIEGWGEFIAEDTGGAIKGNKLDIYRDSHSECFDLGVQYAQVSLIK